MTLSERIAHNAEQERIKRELLRLMGMVPKHIPGHRIRARPRFDVLYSQLDAGGPHVGEIDSKLKGWG